MQNTRNGQREENRRVFFTLWRSYEFLSRFFCTISITCLAVALFFDLLPCQYCSPAVEEFFCGSDFTKYVSTSLVIWTFGASLVIYFIGNMGNRYLGIRFGEALLAHEQMASLVRKTVLFLAEVFLLEFIPTGKLPITFFMVCLLQPLNIVLILLMIFTETSQEKVIDTIKEQNERILARLVQKLPGGGYSANDIRELDKSMKEEKGQWLFFKLLQTLRCSNYEDMRYLEDCLQPVFGEHLKGYPALSLLLAWQVGRAFLENVESNQFPVIPMALTKLIWGIAENQGYPQEMKEGILSAVAVLWNAPDCSDHCRGMLECMEEQERENAIHWSFCLLSELSDCGIRKDLLLDSFGIDECILPAERKQRLDAFVSYLREE